MANLLAYFELGRMEGGCDEAGRGCLSGPVVAAAVILDPTKPIAALNDSKQINEKNRLLLRDQIMSDALAYAIGIVSHEEIDEINILNAQAQPFHKPHAGAVKQTDNQTGQAVDVGQQRPSLG